MNPITQQVIDEIISRGGIKTTYTYFNETKPVVVDLYSWKSAPLIEARDFMDTYYKSLINEPVVLFDHPPMPPIAPNFDTTDKVISFNQQWNTSIHLLMNDSMELQFCMLNDFFSDEEVERTGVMKQHCEQLLRLIATHTKIRIYMMGIETLVIHFKSINRKTIDAFIGQVIEYQVKYNRDEFNAKKLKYSIMYSKYLVI